MRRELSDNSVIKWQGEWDNTTKCAITKLFFPKIADRLKLKINVTPNFTTMVTGHGNIKADLKLRTAKCAPAKEENKQWTTLFICELGEKELDMLETS